MKDQLPVHIILGASDYTKILTSEKARMSQLGEQIFELPKLGWVVISSGLKDVETKMMLSKTSTHSYNICVVGIC